MLAIFVIVAIFCLGALAGFVFGFWVGIRERNAQEGFPVWPLWPTDLKDRGLPGGDCPVRK